MCDRKRNCERELESVFEIHSNLLKFAKARIENSSIVRELKARVQGENWKHERRWWLREQAQGISNWEREHGRGLSERAQGISNWKRERMLRIERASARHFEGVHYYAATYVLLRCYLCNTAPILNLGIVAIFEVQTWSPPYPRFHHINEIPSPAPKSITSHGSPCNFLTNLLPQLTIFITILAHPQSNKTTSSFTPIQSSNAIRRSSR